ncbi:hypothetical protein BG004_007430 [Podila humilis]|nr:hypothetical protein BG004_007430 [Podila humilis]
MNQGLRFNASKSSKDWTIGLVGAQMSEAKLRDHLAFNSMTMAPSTMKVYTSKLCTQMHTPAFEILGGAESQFYESPARREAIAGYLAEHPESFEISENFKDFGEGPIRRVHKKELLEFLETAYDDWIKEGGHPNGVLPATINHHKLARYGKHTATSCTARAGEFIFDLSAVISKDTFKAAWNAAQITLTATEEFARLAEEYQSSVALGGSKDHPPGIYALVRPPGHHAQSDMCGGYCYFNNLAIAAQWLIDGSTKHGGKPKKVAILDIDYHHGNGTQEMFYSTSNPLYTSLHSGDDYPYFTGSEEEKGEGEGLGFNINIPLPHATTNDDYVETLEKLIKDQVVPYKPDYIVVSLGVDTFVDDPIAGFLITTDGYPKIGDVIRRIGVPTLFVQEGGYCIEKLGVNVGGILEGYLGKKA